MASAPDVSRDPVAPHLARGVELHRRGRAEEALAEFERGLHAAPAHAQAQLHAGVTNLQLKRWARGVAHLRVSVAADESRAEAWTNLALGLRELGRHDEARQAAERATALDPKLPEAWNLLGLVAQDQAQHEAARGHFRQALALRPAFALARMNLANSDQLLGRLDEAMAGYRRALESDPTLAEVHYNIAHLFHKTGRAREAIAPYREAIRRDPGYALAHQNLAHVLFLAGEFAEAWSEYRWRPPREAHIAAMARLGLAYDPLRARSLAGARLLVAGEQGLGDVLFFLRFAPWLRAQGATLDFAGESRLLPLLARAGLFERLAPAPEPLRTPEGVEVLAGDLPLLMGGALASHPTPPPLAIPPEAARLAHWRARLAAAGPAPHIALTWRAGEPKRGLMESLFKEVPIEALGAALRGVPGTFIAVQREPAEGEVARLSAALGRTVHDFSAVNRDLEDALAVMALADELAGVSNTNVHLRAAAGRTGRSLVPFPPEWRWMEAGDSPWFPGWTVHREDASRSWEAALRSLAESLAPKGPR